MGSDITCLLKEKRMNNLMLSDVLGFAPDLRSVLLKNHEPFLNRPKFPVYDLIRHDRGLEEIRIALAGYKKNDIKINIVNDILTVESEAVDDSPDLHYLQRAIAKRAFSLKFQLPTNVEVAVTSCTFVDGILTILIQVKEETPKGVLSIPIE